MKQYTIQLVITEGSDEFWEEATADGKSGCDDVLEIVKNVMWNEGLEPDIKLIKYEDK